MASDVPEQRSLGPGARVQLNLTRQELFDLVWSTSRQAIAAQYPDISAAVVTRTCEEANISLPGRGYWAKVAEGHKVRRPTLPTRWPGQNETVVLGRRNGYGHAHDRRSDEEIAASDPPKPPVFVDDIDQLVEGAAAHLQPIRVARDLTAAHPEILKLLGREEQRRAKAAASTWAWDVPRYQGPFFRRQLQILDAIFRGVSPVGKKPSLGEDSAFQQGVGTGYSLTASIDIGSTRVHLAFPLDRVVLPKDSGSYCQKVLRLVLKSWAGGHSTEIVWQEASGRPLERQLPEILRSLLRQAELQRRAGLQRRYEWELERIQDAHRRLEAASEKRIAQRREALLKQAEAFDQASRVRRFADHCEAVGRTPDGTPLADWLALARSVADDLDPSTQVPRS